MWDFHYREEAGAASLRAVIPVAVLRKMDRWISNISHSFRKSRGTNSGCYKQPHETANVTGV